MISPKMIPETSGSPITVEDYTGSTGQTAYGTITAIRPIQPRFAMTVLSGSILTAVHSSGFAPREEGSVSMTMNTTIFGGHILHRRRTIGFHAT